MSSAVYKPRRQEKTELFEVIRKHYKTWAKKSDNTTPFYVHKEFKNYIKCGILSYGFACAHCDACQADTQD